MNRPISLILLLSINQNCLSDINPAAIARNCSICHSANSNSGIAAIPGDNNAAQLKQKLLDFKYDKMTTATLMPRIVKGYSDTELQAVAEYLAGQL